MQQRLAQRDTGSVAELIDVSNSDTADRVRGPEFELATSIARVDTALLIGLNQGDGEVPTLVIGDGIVDDALAEALETGLVALGATGKHGAITRIPCAERTRRRHRRRRRPGRT